MALAAEDESLARLIEMRYFGGMTAEETAEVVGEPIHVVRDDLSLSQAWLRRKLKGYEGYQVEPISLVNDTTWLVRWKLGLKGVGQEPQRVRQLRRLASRRSGRRSLAN